MRSGYPQLVSPAPSELLTKSEAAARLNVNQRYIRHLIEEKRIDIVKIGRHVRIPADAIESLIRAGYKPAVND